jgi:hypothetical protein
MLKCLGFVRSVVSGEDARRGAVGRAQEAGSGARVEGPHNMYAIAFLSFFFFLSFFLLLACFVLYLVSPLAVVHQLNEINFALTTRVMNVLYGEQFGSKEIEINFALYVFSSDYCYSHSVAMRR